MLTTFDEDEYVFQSLKAGALGYLLKSTPAKQVAIAVRNIQKGYSQLGPTIAPKVFAQIKATKQQQHLFNERELEILRLLGLGKSN